MFKQFAIAQTNRDAAFFERVEADSYTVVTRWGQTFTKAAIIADMKTWDSNTRYAYESLDVQLYGDVAVVKGALTAMDTSSSTTWNSIYLLTKVAGQWRILSTTQIK
ncbi:MAG TPA: nuclear transport factor 2 family protein [Pyrinomonadaceae bacterium]|nr:nuclear transport factor 2 family protein [Pyrinomonadaceae bacterium]